MEVASGIVTARATSCATVPRTRTGPISTIFITKLVLLFVYPLGAAILVGAVALALSFTSWRRTGQALLGFTLAALWISATPAFAHWLSWRWESQIPLVTLESLPQSDVVILLGGTPVSRIGRALSLYRAGKAPLIVITGGNKPWQKAVIPEAQRVADLLVEFGVPRSALVLETRSRSTRENAVNTAAVFKERGWRHGLLVTEGVHMPRALTAFQKVGLDVTPAATGIHSGLVKLDNLLDLLPNAKALAWTTSAIKEMIGLFVYRYRGWA